MILISKYNFFDKDVIILKDNLISTVTSNKEYTPIICKFRDAGHVGLWNKYRSENTQGIITSYLEEYPEFNLTNNTRRFQNKIVNKARIGKLSNRIRNRDAMFNSEHVVFYRVHKKIDGYKYCWLFTLDIQTVGIHSYVTRMNNIHKTTLRPNTLAECEAPLILL